MVTKEELLTNFVAEVVIKNKMILVAGQMLSNMKELDNSNQIIKGFETYIRHKKKLKKIY